MLSCSSHERDPWRTVSLHPILQGHLDQDSPVVRGNTTPILHPPPIRPRLDRVHRRIPDTLSPDDILQVKCRAIVHDPFGNLLTGSGGSLPFDQYHPIESYECHLHRQRQSTSYPSPCHSSDPSRQDKYSLACKRSPEPSSGTPPQSSWRR